MKSKKYFLKKVSNYAVVGGLGASLAMGLTGCEQKPTDGQMSEAAQKQGAFVVVEKDPTGAYKIVDEFPSTKTTIVLRENGKERILSKAEVDALVAQEAKKIDEGTSNLTNPNGMGGMSLGETLLASAAGAIIGSYIGNKLFNNQNFQNQRKASYKSPQTYSKSVNSFNKAKSSASKTSTSSKKSGFFGGSKSTSSRSTYGG
ncbi:MAG: UPF0323 family lipoprotein [Campylobacterota bacterium]|nr:UPF0323 family lipoprotein [Campylobacterota bacterium]